MTGAKLAAGVVYLGCHCPRCGGACSFGADEAGDQHEELSLHCLVCRLVIEWRVERGHEDERRIVRFPALK